MYTIKYYKEKEIGCFIRLISRKKCMYYAYNLWNNKNNRLTKVNIPTLEVTGRADHFKILV